MAKLKAPKEYPQLPLGDHPLPDPRDRDLSAYTLVNHGGLVTTRPAIMSASQKPSGALTMPAEERWRIPEGRPGKIPLEHLRARHRIILPQQSDAEIRQLHLDIQSTVKESQVSPVLATVLAERGIKPAAVKTFLDPDLQAELQKLPLFSALERTALRIATSIYSGERVAVITDFDTDGITSGAILARTFQHFGVDIKVFQPDRVLDGYGFTENLLPRINQYNPDLVITSDLGTANVNTLAHLTTNNVSTIVIDHHLSVDQKTSQPDILCNPHCYQGLEPYHGLSAAGLCWLVAHKVHSYLKAGSVESAIELLPFAAMSLVADLMPLVGINRVLVKEGIKQFSQSSIPAVKLLNSFCREKITGETLGFEIGPLFNAVGRIRVGSAEDPGAAPGIAMLRADSLETAGEHFKVLLENNPIRKQKEEEALVEARQLVLKMQKQHIPFHCGFALFLEKAHEGVIGLVASRLTEVYQCPVLVFTPGSDGHYKGSGRSTSDVNILDLLNSPALKPFLLSCGGHAVAVGAKVSQKMAAAFAQTFNALCKRIYIPEVPDDSPFEASPRPTYLPAVNDWYKSYTPDLRLSVSEAVNSFKAISAAASRMEPCGRGHEQIKILLEKARIEIIERMPSGHLRLVITDASQQSCVDAPRLLATVYKNSLVNRILANFNDHPEQIFNVVVQPALDRGATFKTQNRAPLVQISMLDIYTETALSKYPLDSKKVAPKDKTPQAAKTPNPDLFDRLLTTPDFKSIADFAEHFDIRYLSPKLEFRKEQIDYIARQFKAEENNQQRNLIVGVNTGGGKTIIGLIFAAKTLSKSESAKVLYLTPQQDLVDQVLISAQDFLDLPENAIAEVSGQVSPKKRTTRYDQARLLVATPETILNDLIKSPDLLKKFSLVVMDEVHFMRPDQHGREQTKYAYREVAKQLRTLQSQGASCNILALSGTAGRNKAEVVSLQEMLAAAYDATRLSTGKQLYRKIDVKLDPQLKRALGWVQESYFECLHNFLTTAPNEKLKAIHLHKNEQMPARGQLIQVARALFEELKEAKNYPALSFLHELEYTSRLFEELKSKGRQAFMRSVTHKMAEALFPKDQDQPTPIYSYKVRAHLRTEMKHALDWALTEDTANTIHTLFKNAYPLNYLPEIKFRRTATAQIINQPWQTYLAAPVSKTIMADWIDSNLAQESAQTPYRDAKEIALLAHLKTLPANAKVLINCEEIYEAKLLATRLNSAGISAGWYAGKSVPKREGTAENLKKFRAGELQVLCATSAADTGHDIADVSEVIRIKPLTSPIKNSQSAGRSGRQAGLTGRYRTLINRDSNPSFSEEQQYLIGLHRIRAMRKAAQRRVID